jgi:hypothetical protein
MITAEKLRIYLHHKGDIDGFSRAYDPYGKSIITDDDWSLIDVLWQRLALEQSVRCTESFRAETQRLLVAHVADTATAAQLRQLSA